jgi:high affinity sulfate transporter 1
VDEHRSARRPLVSVAPPSWVRGYQRRWLTRDALAGLTLWALVVPEAMAYAAIAGVPPQYGLYSVPLAVLAYAWLGSSQRLFVGPSSTVAALAATVVAPLAVVESDEYVVATAVLSLLVGTVFVLLALLRMGFVSRLFAEPVLDGFVIGLGVFVVVGQLPKLVAIEKAEGNTLQQLWEVLASAGDWNATSLLVGLGAMATLFLLRWVAPRVPAALVVVLAALVLAPAASLEERGVELVGEIPSGFAFASWDTVSPDLLLQLVPGALAVVVVGFAEGLAVSKAYAAADGTVIDPDRELLANGAASIGSGVLQGFPPAGSLSKSAAAKEGGARTPMAFVVTGGLVVLTVLFLTGMFVNLPEPVLGAIVIHAVAGMIRPRKIWHLRQIRVPDFWLALATFAGVVLVEVMPGMVIGVVVSLLLLLQRLSTPRVAVLGRHPERGFVGLDSNLGAEPLPGTVILRPEGPLVFASVDPVVDELRRLVLAAEPRPSLVVLDLEVTSEIDVTAADALAGVVAELRAGGTEVRFASVHSPVRDYVRRLDHEELAGVAAPYATVGAALAEPGEP